MPRCLLLVLAIAASAAAADAASTNAIVSLDFERWVWLPITPSMAEGGRQTLKDGEQLDYECRGPLYRAPEGFVNPAGRMVEGAQAFKGRSALFETGKRGAEVGLHRPFGGILAPGRSYAYRVALKGKGTFRFSAWVGGDDPTSGKFQWLGFPVLIALKPSDAWQVYEGTFQVPAYNEPPLVVQPRISAAIVVDPGSKVYVDDFVIEELKPETGSERNKP